MAVDTRNKRSSVLGLALSVTLTLPLADGTVALADRQHVAFCYAGIDATVSVVPASVVGTGSYDPQIDGRGSSDPTVDGWGSSDPQIDGRGSSG